MPAQKQKAPPKPKSKKVTVTVASKGTKPKGRPLEEAPYGFKADGTPKAKPGAKSSTGMLRPPKPARGSEDSERRRKQYPSPAEKSGVPDDLMLQGGKYNPRFCLLVARFGRIGKGLTDFELAALFECAPSTLEKWIRAYPEFKVAVMEAREISNARVERALFDRAVGYSHPEDKVFYDRLSGDVVVVPGVKHYPPDTAAAVFWLKNRDPATWKERIEYVPQGGGRTLRIEDEDAIEGSLADA